MRIISKFHDYYDLQNLQDDWPLFVRKNNIFPLTPKSLSHHQVLSKKGFGLTISQFIVGFANDFYPGFYFYSDGHKLIHAYGMEQLLKYCRPSSKYQRRMILAFFTQLSLDYYKVTNYRHLFDKSPVWVAYGHRFETNPILRTWGFQKMLDPYTAHQKLDHYLSNQAQNLDEAQPIADPIMAQAKGFDKWSFRQKGPKKRKRKS